METQTCAIPLFVMRSWNDDPFTKQARRENFAARSIYKLSEIDQRDRVLEGARSVLDLGASPGSWSQYCLQSLPMTQVFAIDLNPIHVSNPRLKFLQSDIDTADLKTFISPLSHVDVVLSDMAPKTTGIRSVDADSSTELVQTAIGVSDVFLKEKGNLVVKLFMSESLKPIEAEFRYRFKVVRMLRPESTRKQSREIFMIGKSRLPR